jgi:anti-sigma regulatory factor (Ser/Thr protein kinase)
VTTDLGRISNGRFSHDLLLHEREDELVDGTRMFVDQGLASGGEVIVHGTEPQVASLREALGRHPRLQYALTCDLVQCSFGTLFAAQRRLAESPEPLELWTVGIRPPSEDFASGSPWARVESLLNEVLGAHAFHALCTYDTRTVPAPILAVGRATHPHVSNGRVRATNPDYQQPADFLAHPLAAVPGPPDVEPVAATSLHDLRELKRARQLVERHAARSALPRDTTRGLVTALNEVLVNALVHGTAPAQLRLWVEPAKLTCEVVDAGPGIPDPLTGCRYPEPSGPLGLWVARQSCDDVVIRNLPGGGCSVLLVTP